MFAVNKDIVFEKKALLQLSNVILHGGGDTV